MRESDFKVLSEESRVSRLAKRLTISESALWQFKKEQRHKGGTIDSAPRAGYSFSKGPDLLLPEEISRGLNTYIIGQSILYQKGVTSTQDVAEEMAKGGGEEGLVVIAEEQTKGRGRQGRRWNSPAREGVYLSILLRPKTIPSQILQIPLITGVAVAKAIKKVTPLQPRLKWPNDIMLGEKKVGGVLTEMRAERDRINHVILGIGVNVNTPKLLLPESIRATATSLAEECGEYVSRITLVQTLLAELEALYSQFLVSGFSRIREEWKALNNTLSSRVRVSSGEEEIEGEALDIDQNGFLVIRDKKGDIKRIISGDVSLRRQDG